MHRLALFFHKQELMFAWYQATEQNDPNPSRASRIPLCFFSLSGDKKILLEESPMVERVELFHETIHANRFLFVTDCCQQLPDVEEDSIVYGGCKDEWIALKVIEKLRVAYQSVNETFFKQLFDQTMEGQSISVNDIVHSVMSLSNHDEPSADKIWLHISCILLLETYVPVCFWFEKVSNKGSALTTDLVYQKATQSVINNKLWHHQMKQIITLLSNWVKFSSEQDQEKRHDAISSVLTDHFEQSILARCYETLKDLILKEKQSSQWSSIYPLIQSEIVTHERVKLVSDDLRDGYILTYLRLLQRSTQLEDDVSWTIPFVLLERRGLRQEFPLRVTEEATRSLEFLSSRAVSQQKPNIITLTIDPRSTQDFDDAISIVDYEHNKFIQLEVLITNVSQIFLQENYSTDTVLRNSIFNEALARVTTTYIPDRFENKPSMSIFPMIPKELSTGKLSLHQNKSYNVVAYEYILFTDGSYEFKGVKVRQNVQIDSNMTYDAADECINRDSSDDFWVTLSNCCAAIRSKRVQRGASVFDDFSNSVSDDSIQIDDSQRRAKKSCTIITELSVLVNSDIANYCVQHKIPTLYKAQSSVHIKSKSVSSSTSNKDNKPRAGVAFITPVPSGNTLTASEYYTQQTSPVRRFVDLVSQTTVVHFLLSKQGSYVPLFSQELLESWSRHIELLTVDRAALEKRIRYYHMLCEMKLKLQNADNQLTASFESYDKANNITRWKVPALKNTSILCSLSNESIKKLPAPKEQRNITIIRVDPDLNRIEISIP